MEVGERVMMIENNRPVFVTIHSIVEMWENHPHKQTIDVVYVEEREGYIFKDELWSEEKIMAWFEGID